MKKFLLAAAILTLASKLSFSSTIGTCKEGQARLFTDYNAESIDDSACVELKECNQNDMVVLPWGMQAKETCIPRVSPKDSRVKSPYALLAYFPNNPILPYQSVPACSATQTPVYWAYLHNYVCPKTPPSCVITQLDQAGNRSLLVNGKPVASASNALTAAQILFGLIGSPGSYEDQDPSTQTLMSRCSDLKQKNVCGSCTLLESGN